MAIKNFKKLILILEKKLYTVYNNIGPKNEPSVGKIGKINGGKKMATRDKNIWVLLLFILSGLVIGGLLGELAKSVDWLWWLSFGQEFGLENPIILDLSVITITFAMMFRINIASIIGMALAIFIYRKV